MKTIDKKTPQLASKIVIKEFKKSNIDLVKEFSCCKKTQRTTTTTVN